MKFLQKNAVYRAKVKKIPAYGIVVEIEKSNITSVVASGEIDEKRTLNSYKPEEIVEVKVIDIKVHQRNGGEPEHHPGNVQPDRIKYVLSIRLARNDPNPSTPFLLSMMMNISQLPWEQN